MWPMSDAVRRNDLLAYESLTRPDGPAMTWSMHSIGFLDLGDFNKAEQLFRRSYETYVRPPFNVRCYARIDSFSCITYSSFCLGLD
jgi:protein-glucosylgalactosylhydroxylysine glucosidase